MGVLEKNPTDLHQANSDAAILWTIIKKALTVLARHLLRNIFGRTSCSLMILVKTTLLCNRKTGKKKKKGGGERKKKKKKKKRERFRLFCYLPKIN